MSSKTLLALLLLVGVVAIANAQYDYNYNYQPYPYGGAVARNHPPPTNVKPPNAHPPATGINPDCDPNRLGASEEDIMPE